jgi:hypothetical protein
LEKVGFKIPLTPLPKGEKEAIEAKGLSRSKRLGQLK